MECRKLISTDFCLPSMSHAFYINFAISRLWKWGYYHFQFNKLLQYALMPDQHNRYQLFLPSLYFVLQAEIIHKHEYKTWRSTGIAFEPREATYDVPNKTLASGVVVNQVSAQIKQSAACHWDLIAKKWWWLKLKKVPNKCVYLQGGEKVSRRGYWGDIVASPFLAFGIQSEDKLFFKKSNNMYTKVLNLSVLFGV